LEPFWLFLEPGQSAIIASQLLCGRDGTGDATVATGIIADAVLESDMLVSIQLLRSSRDAGYIE
jgi:hypothetical protein